MPTDVWGERESEAFEFYLVVSAAISEVFPVISIVVDICQAVERI